MEESTLTVIDEDIEQKLLPVSLDEILELELPGSSEGSWWKDYQGGLENHPSLVTNYYI